MVTEIEPGLSREATASWLAHCFSEHSFLLRGADLAGALAICDRLGAGAASCACYGLHPCLSVTLSLGVAASREGATREEVVALADTRLYWAKRSARNKVEAA